ncbi:MAG: DUF4105 domain-containing protein, partial [Myxococcota bacterium]
MRYRLPPLPLRAFVLLFGLALFLAPASASAQGPGQTQTQTRRAIQYPSTTPDIVLYTMGNGNVIFEKWGHAALCIEYPRSPRYSRCYNYGTTDFRNPSKVVWEFLRGGGTFWVSVTTPDRMIRRYMAFDRTLWRQVLPLSPEQAQRAADMLRTDALPENRYYTYNHFFNNCSTRVRDIIDQASDGLLSRDAEQPVGPTFRDYARRGFAEMTWALVGTDYMLGRQADVQPNLWELMFLPRYMREQVTLRFGVEPNKIFQRRGHEFSQDPGLGGRHLVVLLALLLAGLIALSRWAGSPRQQTLAVTVAVVPSFLISLIMWGLASISSLEALRYNEILLVYLPFDIVLPFLRSDRRQHYARIRIIGLILVSLLAAIGVFNQPLWIPIL